MLFKADMIDAIQAGRKTQTRRPQKDNPGSPWYRGGCRYQPGYEFPIQGAGMREVARGVVTGLRAEMVGMIGEREAVMEGFVAGENPHGWFPTAVEAFFGYFELIHKTEIDRSMGVWVVTFERVERDRG